MPAVALALLLAQATAFAALATTRPLSIRDLTGLADTVVVGRVGRPQPETSAAAIATRVPVDVEQVLKGAAGPVVTLVEAGGERGGVVATVGGAPTFTAGERVLLFLIRRGDGALRVAHLYQGKFSIETDPATGTTRVVRRAPDTSEILDAMPLADALAMIRAARPAGSRP